MQHEERAFDQPRSPVRLRLIALPVEHGGWGLLGAPIVLGLWLAPSLAGIWLCLAAVGAFLARQPLKLAVADYYRGRRYPRTVWAERFVVGYGILILIGLGLAIYSAAAPFWPPLALAAPAALVQLIFDLRKQSRELVAELSGAVAISALAAAIVMAASWPLSTALLLWLLLAMQAITAIIYVRIRLRLARHEPVRRASALLWHSLALTIVGGLLISGAVGWPVVAVFALLMLRCWMGLRPRFLTTPTPLVGVQEVLFSLITVVGIGLDMQF
ncbi:MAG: YwiC-like family protein [Chloroflexus sp.]